MLAIGICLLAIVVPIIIGIKTDQSLVNSNECIIGTTKKEGGFLQGGCLDVWHIYHVLFWLLIGILMPNRIFLVLGLSLAWEVVEHFVFRNVSAFHCRAIFCGRIEDIFSNMIGYLIGSYCHRIVG
jgi:hypothetical protein